MFPSDMDNNHKEFIYRERFLPLSILISNEQMNELVKRYAAEDPGSGLNYDWGIMVGTGYGIYEGLKNTIIALKDMAILLYELEKAWLGFLWDRVTSPLNNIMQVIDFFQGAGDVAVFIANELIHNPNFLSEIIEALQEVGAAIGAGFKNIINMISKAVDTKIENWLAKDFYDQGFAIGNAIGVILFEVIIALVGTKGLDKLAKAAKGSKFVAFLGKIKLGKLTSLIDKLIDSKRLADIARKLDKIENLKNLGSSKNILGKALSKVDDFDSILTKLNRFGDDFPKIMSKLKNEDEIFKLVNTFDNLEADKLDEITKIITELDNDPHMKMSDILNSPADDVIKQAYRGSDNLPDNYRKIMDNLTGKNLSDIPDEELLKLGYNKYLEAGEWKIRRNPGNVTDEYAKLTVDEAGKLRLHDDVYKVTITAESYLENLAMLRKRFGKNHPIHWEIWDKATPRNFEVHHWINKAKVNGTKPHDLFESLIDDGLTDVVDEVLKADWNQDLIPHRGGHVEDYYKAVKDKLDFIHESYDDYSSATGKVMDSAEVKRLFKEAVDSIKKQMKNGDIQLYTEI